jgi:ribosomal silencing factor RsfS
MSDRCIHQLVMAFHFPDQRCNVIQIHVKQDLWEMHSDVSEEESEDEWKVIHIAKGDKLIELFLKQFRDYFSTEGVSYEFQENIMLKCDTCETETIVSLNNISTTSDLEFMLGRLSARWSPLRTAILNDSSQVD